MYGAHDSGVLVRFATHHRPLTWQVQAPILGPNHQYSGSGGGALLRHHQQAARAAVSAGVGVEEGGGAGGLRADAEQGYDSAAAGSTYLWELENSGGQRPAKRGARHVVVVSFYCIRPQVHKLGQPLWDSRGHAEVRGMNSACGSLGI